jgi:hypothetical protein
LGLVEGTLLKSQGIGAYAQVPEADFWWEAFLCEAGGLVLRKSSILFAILDEFSQSFADFPKTL